MHSATPMILKLNSIKGCTLGSSVFYRHLHDLPKENMMSDLSQVFPTDRIVDLVPGAEIVSLGKPDIKEIALLKPKTMHEMGMATWHAAMQSGNFNVDPKMLAKYIDDGDPHILKRVSQALGQKVVFDISYCFATLPDVKLEEPAIQTLVAHLYPSRLHIGDVKLLDPRRPRSDTEHAGDQSHESLRLFSVFLNNCKIVAKNLGAEKISLTAAYVELVETFRAHGFEVEDSELARLGLRFGMGIPMEINL